MAVAWHSWPHLFLVIFTLAGAKGCCREKRTGGFIYQLTSETIEPLPASCDESCLYIRVGDDTREQWCFGPGPDPTECLDTAEATPPTGGPPTGPPNIVPTTGPPTVGSTTGPPTGGPPSGPPTVGPPIGPPTVEPTTGPPTVGPNTGPITATTATTTTTVTTTTTIGQTTTAMEVKCEDIKGKDGKPGECISKTKCSSTNSLIVGNKCPGTTYCCISNPFPCDGDTDFEDDNHLANTEGSIWLEGYIPSTGSGVTIATGYDLGHGPDIAACLNNQDLVNRLLPYRQLKSVSELEAAGFTVKEIKNSAGTIYRRELDPKAPVVSLEEARKIDCCLKEKAYEDTAPYTEKMECGKVVVASLQHYCGATGLLGGGSKCSAGGEDLVGDVLKTETGTDANLLTALEKLHAAHPVGGRKERIRKEMEYMKTCMNKAL